MNAGNNPIHPILLVDDERGALDSLSIALEFNGINNVLTCNDSSRAFEMAETNDVEAIFLDLIMPGVGGEDILDRLTLQLPDIPVIITTGVGDIDTAVRCMHKGAFDYITKPVDTERLSASLVKALEFRNLKRQNAILARNLLMRENGVPEAFEEFITRDRQLLSVLRYCEAVARGSEPVMIQGETGAGKEILARGIHRASGRAGSFVAVNLAGLDDQMFSDTLFGHVKGAFTGADAPRKGLIESAYRGTLFLDEIGDLGEASQVRLLRVLQEREYLPLGSDNPVNMDTRILAATHHDLPELTRQGRFRQDLYYRLKTHIVRIPPLRERKADIPLLLDHFLALAAEDSDKPTPSYPPELLTLLRSYHFPGNVRELRAMVYDAILTHPGKLLSTSAFQKAMNEPSPSEHPGGMEENLFRSCEQLPTLKEASEALVREALLRTEGNQRIAAGMLGITPSALSRRLKPREDD